MKICFFLNERVRNEIWDIYVDTDNKLLLQFLINWLATKKYLVEFYVKIRLLNQNMICFKVSEVSL